LPLPAGAYPTVAQVLTHTSGLKSYYLEWPMVGNALTGKNSFYGVTKQMVLKRLAEQNGKLQESPFQYANYGYAVLGAVLEKAYGEPYAVLANRYAQHTLGLASTKISDQLGDLGKYWDWNETDAYLPAGAITSNIEDMLQYARLQLEEAGTLSRCHTPLRSIRATTDTYAAMGIRLDSIGMAWIIDEHAGIIWHNGGTSNYNSYLGFCPKTNTAVVVLSNLAPNNRIPATVLGIKKLEELQ
ncbi:MAG: serine hydrolase, partial [Eubacteriales bacterium]|nr:serine hydrolase [Eubacteriales bacterium]